MTMADYLTAPYVVNHWAPNNAGTPNSVHRFATREDAQPVFDAAACQPGTTELMDVRTGEQLDKVET